MIERVLEYARNRSVVFGSYEHDGIDGAQLALESLHFGCLGAVVVLVVQRQVADAQFLEIEVGRRELDQRIRELPIE
jgi:hypothetical protein